MTKPVIDERTPACPFCGSHSLSETDWWDDDGEYPAIECDACKGAAPLEVWMAQPSHAPAGKPGAILLPQRQGG